MYEVNRSVVLIVPKEPFWLWIRSLDEEELGQITLEHLQADPNAYLVDACDDIEDAWNQVEENMEEIFTAELADWSEDKNDWPDLHIDIFFEWFDVELSSIVTDLSQDKLEREEFVPFALDI